MNKYVNILSIAGSDCCGCAGIQADIMTGTACGVHVATAITAVTVQDTRRFLSVNPVSAATVREQIETVVADVTIDAVKIGMLPNADIIEVVTNCIGKLKLNNVVIDPIGVATVGQSDSGENVSMLSLLGRLLGQADIITPNMKEAEMLLGESVEGVPGREVAYRLHRKYGVKTVLVTGGDLNGDIVCDSFYSIPGKEEGEFFGSRIASRNTHGSGCALSTAIASRLALGDKPLRAIAEAERLVHNLIAFGEPYIFGKGHYGPLGFIDFNHEK